MVTLWKEPMDLNHSLNNMAKPWLQGPLALSKESCRFELPMDMHVLEKISVLEYLTEYCVVCSRRQQLYKQSFVRADKDRDGHLTLHELEDTLTNVVYIQPDAKKCLKEITDMITDDHNPASEAADDKKQLKINFKCFKGIGAFLERMICWSMEKQNGNEGIKWSHNDKRNTLEQTDFDGLKWKLKGCNIDAKLMNLFRYL